MTYGAIAADLLGAEGDAVFVRLAYLTVLGREPEDGRVDQVVEALAKGATTRTDVIAGMMASSEFAEARLTDRLITDGATPTAADPVGPGTTERLIEIPWVLSHYRGESRVLDVGYANAPRRYLTALLRVGIPDLHAVDMATGPLPGAARTSADVRALPYRDDAFELVTCISTLEHIGRDNSRYGLPEAGSGGDADALAELARVLRPGGRLLVTVPYGAAEDHGWFVQYDRRRWDDLVAASPLAAGTREAFRMTAEGWVRETDETALARCHYGDGALGASSVLCAELVRQ